MLTVEIVELKRRRWMLFRPRRFSLQMPVSWAEVTPLARRQRWWRWLMTLPRPAATRAMVRDLLPKWVRRRISDLDFAGLTMLLDWAKAEHDCLQVPIPCFEHAGTTFHFPTRKGENVSCIEYALADDYYKQFTDGDTDAMLNLVAAIWREPDQDQERALRRDDQRTPLHSKAEVARRVTMLRSAPAEIHLQALLYFGGLKAYIHRVYGNWLFEETEDESDEEGISDQEKAPSSPDFGWWGIFQSVAESGVFGNLDQVYQASLHDVCIFLVRKRVENNNAPNGDSPAKVEDPEDE